MHRLFFFPLYARVMPTTIATVIVSDSTATRVKQNKTIQVVLTGPFTRVQKAITSYQRIEVRVNYVIEALQWLKLNVQRALSRCGY